MGGGRAGRAGRAGWAGRAGRAERVRAHIGGCNIVLLNRGRAGRKRIGWAGMAGRVLEAVILYY